MAGFDVTGMNISASADRAHGGRREEAARRLGIPKEELLDFSASINPLGPPPAALEAITKSLAEVAYYPEESGAGLAENVADFLGVAPAEVALGNGSIEIIYWLAALLGPRRVLIVEPTFSEYRTACQAAGAECESLMLAPADDFVLDVESVDPRGRDLVFVCNPNNPSGNLTDSEQILYLWQKCRAAGAALVVDEAFIDFAGAGSSVLSAGVREGLYVIRSFTKSFALAGLRIGCLAAEESLAAALRARMPAWNINCLARAAARAALADGDYLVRTRKLTPLLRERLFTDLNGVEGVRPFPSAANFILFHAGPFGAGRGGIERGSSGDLAGRLELQGILVRDCRSFRGLGDGYIRVAVRDERDNSQLLSALRWAVEKLNG